MTQKDNPARLLAANYPARVPIRCLYADVDSFRHINNGAIGRYVEEGRADLMMRVFGVSALLAPENGQQLLLASVNIDFLHQTHYPGNVEVGSALGRAGTSSMVIVQAVFQNDACVVLAESIMVKAVDGRSAPLSDAERSALESYRFEG